MNINYTGRKLNENNQSMVFQRVLRLNSKKHMQIKLKLTKLLIEFINTAKHVE